MGARGDHVTEEDLFVQDLGSKNGTRVHGWHLQVCVPVKLGWSVPVQSPST